MSPTEGTAASLARLAGHAWLRMLRQGVELLPAAQTQEFPAAFLEEG